MTHQDRHMELGLDIAKALGPGRRPEPLAVEVVREIEESDLIFLATTPGNTQAEPIKKITSRHHMVARLLAVGTKKGEIAMITGYDISRISILQKSPAMQELIQLYKGEVDEKFSGVLEHMAGMSLDAVMLLRDRMEESPEDLSVKDLKEIAEMALDRTGHPRAKEVNTNINVNFASRLEAARERARAAALGNVEEAEVIEDE